MKSSRLQAALDRIDANRKRISEQQSVTAVIPIALQGHINLSNSINGVTNHERQVEIRSRRDVISNEQTTDVSRPRDIPTLENETSIQPIGGKKIEESEFAEWLDSAQLSACNSIIAGESICLIGKAGTGKTTAIRETVSRLIGKGNLRSLTDIGGHRHLRLGFLGVVCCAFTNRATNNIAKGFDLGITPIHFITVHKLLEYRKEECYVEDKETGLQRRSFRFIPGRDRHNPIPAGVKLIILEESSQINKSDLHQKLMEACYGRTIQFVYLGDLQQLPPIGGDGILGYKINELPTIELTTIYRQAAENPIIKLAWDISNGRELTKSVLVKDYSPTRSLIAPIRINFWERKIDWESANIAMGRWIVTQIDADIFNWERNDIILMPYNKQFGTIELNKAIAAHLSRKAGKETYEIIAGFQKHYYACGDKVLYSKKEGIVTKIVRNGRYIGKSPLPSSIQLSRDGTYVVEAGSSAVAVGADEHGMTEQEMDRYLDNLTQSADDEIMNQASHIMNIKLLNEQMPDGSDEVEISTRGEFGECEFGYAISIHKSQGSEWRKVFLILHHSHHQLSREMLYTAVTRASQQLFVIAEPDSFVKAVGRQRIPGDTLEEKKSWFLEKINSTSQQLNGDNDE